MWNPLLSAETQSLFFYVSNIISFRSVELFLVWFSYSRVVPASIFSDDFVLCSSMLEANISSSQLLNEPHNNDCHSPRANTLKCVIYTSQTTLNAMFVWEAQGSDGLFVPAINRVICVISFSAEMTLASIKCICVKGKCTFDYHL